jgi:hypothetical protein
VKREPSIPSNHCQANSMASIQTMVNWLQSIITGDDKLGWTTQTHFETKTSRYYWNDIYALLLYKFRSAVWHFNWAEIHVFFWAVMFLVHPSFSCSVSNQHFPIATFWQPFESQLQTLKQNQ